MLKWGVVDINNFSYNFHCEVNQKRHSENLCLYYQPCLVNLIYYRPMDKVIVSQLNVCFFITESLAVLLLCIYF